MSGAFLWSENATRTTVLEDRTLANYCYWDGTILKGTDAETGKDKYYMFASRWDQANGHSGWGGSVAVYATSDNLEGPYTDQGMLVAGLLRRRRS